MSSQVIRKSLFFVLYNLCLFSLFSDCFLDQSAALLAVLFLLSIDITWAGVRFTLWLRKKCPPRFARSLDVRRQVIECAEIGESCLVYSRHRLVAGRMVISSFYRAHLPFWTMREHAKLRDYNLHLPATLSHSFCLHNVPFRTSIWVG